MQSSPLKFTSGVARPRSQRAGRRWWIWLLVFAAFALFHDLGWTPGRVNAEEGDAQAAAADEPGDAAEPGGGHSDPVAPLLLAIVLILLAAKVAGDLAERVGMPAVLGELAIGIVLGNFALFTGGYVTFFEEFKPPDHHATADSGDGNTRTAAEEPPDPYATGAVLKMLAGIGVVLLLFEVGLESSVKEMLSVGKSALLVAMLGVVTPMVLGYLTGLFLIPDAGWEVHLFIGATLCATSVGITARVLKDLGRSRQQESRIILGAAVIDDVLGLIVLAIVSGVITQSQIAAVATSADSPNLLFQLIKITLLAFGFLAAAFFFGTLLITRPLFKMATFLRGHGLLVTTSLVICFGFSWLANLVQLAPIVGAFAAGLILERAHYQELGKRENIELEDALAPLSALLVPIFFVQMGLQVDLSSFGPSVWGLAAAITVVAIISKQVCAWGVREPGLNRIAVGLGMIPRGEVGLIFADQGAKLGVVDPATFASIIVMVMVTTMVTPPLLKWSLSRGPDQQPY